MLTILIAFMGIVNATAQEVDSLQTQQSDVVVDSMAMTKQNKLQRDFDFLSCRFEVTEVMNALSNFIQEVKIGSLEILISCYHNSFSYDLYKTWKDNFNAQTELFEGLKEKVSSVTVSISFQMLLSDFSKEEVDILMSAVKVFATQIDSAESALKVYEIALDMYGR